MKNLLIATFFLSTTDRLHFLRTKFGHGCLAVGDAEAYGGGRGRRLN